MQNHVIDPTFFWDAIEEFSFDYTIHIAGSYDIDDEGNQVEKYSTQTIRGSLQSNGIALHQSKSGNTKSKTYDFYCKSLYRINIGDIIEYKNNFYRVNEVNNDYDEYGVRAAKLSMIQLSSYRRFTDYLRYLRGDELV